MHLFLGAGMTMVLIGPAARVAGMGGTTMIGILAVLFFCNFGGYVVLNVALYLPALDRFQHVTRALLVGYTALTFLAYFAIARGASLNLFGLSGRGRPYRAARG